MAAVAFTSLAELQSMISPARTLDLFDDDADGSVDPADSAVAFALNAANDAVFSLIFQKGFSAAQIAILAADASLRRLATAIFAQYGGERRTEFLDKDGNGRYHTIGARARADLKEISRGELRLRIEGEGAGANPIVSADTNIGAPIFIVARDPRYPGRPGPGGF
jgi:hypothetical protein